MKNLLIIFVLAGALSACSVQNAYVYPESIQKKYVITTGDIGQAYDSLGYIQISKAGVTLFGFWDLNDATLQGMFEEVLIDEINKAGASGIINLRFHEVQYTTATRVLFSTLLFFIPLPNRVEVTGELVKLKSP